uniref:Uncharacterized protein n=1 Tax=Oryza sativa subsp. japonica TaxID=39947 RepID=Q109H8_ORYSJ|nr:hypothetical protein LOC_Os10g34694 [Oryza sativa Japonica Group]
MASWRCANGLSDRVLSFTSMSKTPLRAPAMELGSLPHPNSALDTQLFNYADVHLHGDHIL